MSGGSSLKTSHQVHTTLIKGVKVLQKEHIFIFPHASAEFWRYFSEITAALPPITFNIIILKNKLIKIMAAVVAAVWRQLAAVWRRQSGLKILLPPRLSFYFKGLDIGGSKTVEKITYKQVFGASDSSLSGSLRPYDYIKNRLFIHILKIVLSGLSYEYIKRFNQFCFGFVYSNVPRGSNNRRKLTELAESKGWFCDQRCVQQGLSYGFIRIKQQIRYLVSCLPPSKNSIWFGHFLPLLHSINWRVFRRVFLRFVSVGFLRFRVLDLRKVGGGGGVRPCGWLSRIKSECSKWSYHSSTSASAGGLFCPQGENFGR